MPPPVLTAVAVAAICALVALAGAEVGPAAAVLAVPVAAAAAVVAALERRRVAALRAASLRDPLTGLGNRRLLLERFSEELARHRRHGVPLALVVLDLDGFKQVNDRFGHPAGDDVLLEVAAALRGELREEDIAARAGGDEFWVLAPQTDASGAASLAARLQDAVTRGVGLQGVTASAGWATAPEHGADARSLIEAADAAQAIDKRSRPRGAQHAA